MKVCDENDDENPFTKVPYCSDSDGEEACYTNLLYANGNEDNDIDVKSLQQFLFVKGKLLYYTCVKVRK